MKPVATAVLISGRGSNLAALIAAAKNPDYPAEIRLVLSNHSQAKGLELARDAGIETAVIDHRPFGQDRLSHEKLILKRLQQAGIQLIALAGYMRILTPFLVQAYPSRIINIHPSLLPLYPGLHTHARAIMAKDAFAGCTVHYVTEDLDAGPILGQVKVPISPEDTEDSLSEKVLEQEHDLYPKCLAAVARQIQTKDSSFFEGVMTPPFPEAGGLIP